MLLLRRSWGLARSVARRPSPFAAVASLGDVAGPGTAPAPLLPPSTQPPSPSPPEKSRATDDRTSRPLLWDASTPVAQIVGIMRNTPFHTLLELADVLQSRRDVAAALWRRHASPLSAAAAPQHSAGSPALPRIAPFLRRVPDVHWEASKRFYANTVTALEIVLDDAAIWPSPSSSSAKPSLPSYSSLSLGDLRRLFSLLKHVRRHPRLSLIAGAALPACVEKVRRALEHDRPPREGNLHEQQQDTSQRAAAASFAAIALLGEAASFLSARRILCPQFASLVPPLLSAAWTIALSSAVQGSDGELSLLRLPAADHVAPLVECMVQHGDREGIELVVSMVEDGWKRGAGPLATKTTTASLSSSSSDLLDILVIVARAVQQAGAKPSCLLVILRAASTVWQGRNSAPTITTAAGTAAADHLAPSQGGGLTSLHATSFLLAAARLACLEEDAAARKLAEDTHLVTFLSVCAGIVEGQLRRLPSLSDAAQEAAEALTSPARPPRSTRSKLLEALYPVNRHRGASLRISDAAVVGTLLSLAREADGLGPILLHFLPPLPCLLDFASLAHAALADRMEGRGYAAARGTRVSPSSWPRADVCIARGPPSSAFERAARASVVAAALQGGLREREGNSAPLFTLTSAQRAALSRLVVIPDELDRLLPASVFTVSSAAATIPKVLLLMDRRPSSGSGDNNAYVPIGNADPPTAWVPLDMAFLVARADSQQQHQQQQTFRGVALEFDGPTHYVPFSPKELCGALGIGVPDARPSVSGGEHSYLAFPSDELYRRGGSKLALATAWVERHHQQQQHQEGGSSSVWEARLGYAERVRDALLRATGWKTVRVRMWERVGRSAVQGEGTESAQGAGGHGVPPPSLLPSPRLALDAQATETPSPAAGWSSLVYRDLAALALRRVADAAAPALEAKEERVGEAGG